MRCVTMRLNRRTCATISAVISLTLVREIPQSKVQNDSVAGSATQISTVPSGGGSSGGWV